MEIDALTQFIISAAPAVTSIIGVIVALIVGIKRIKAAGDSNAAVLNEKYDLMLKNSNELLKQNQDMKNSIQSLLQENYTLKQHLNILTAIEQKGRYKKNHKDEDEGE